ncbi:MAG: hypothetical protein IIZ33_03070 [Erysipelotrichaceae bacterium]|nr:hypothetical protein [Erysipelotrichaceae bacterium]
MGFPSLLLLLLLNIYPVFFLKTDFGKSFPLTICASVLIIYLGGLLGNLLTGFILLLILAVGALYILFRNFSEEGFRKRYFHISFYLALVFFLLVFLLHLNRHFRFIDEFAHLGFMAKESFRLKQFYTVDASNLWYHKDYPPFFTLLEFLWCQASFAYEEYLCYQALTFFELSLFLPFFSFIEDFKKHKADLLLLTLLFGCAGFFIGHTEGLGQYTLVYSSIYIDWPIAYLLAYLFYQVTTMDLSDKREYLFLGIYSSALILSKQIALAFWLLISVTLLLRCLFHKKVTWKLLWLLVPLFFYYSWSVYVAQFEVESAFSFENYDFLAVLHYLRGSLSEELVYIFERYVEAIMNRGIILRPLPLSYFTLSILGFAFLTVCAFLRKDRKKDILLTAVMSLLGSIGYAYALLLSYLYDFGIIEGPSLTMFDRYALTYILAEAVLIVMLYVRVIRGSLKKEIIALAILCLFINIHTVSSSRPRPFEGSLYEESAMAFKEKLEKVPEDKKIVLISQYDHTKQCALRYYADTSRDILILDLIHPEEENAFGRGTFYWEEDFWHLMYDYDYVYICDVEDSFYDTYWKMVTETPLKEDTMYKITHYWDYWVGVEEMK